MKSSYSQLNDPGPRRGPDAPQGAPAAPQAPGLVTSHTSGTSEGLVELDPFLTRLRRLRRSVLTAARMHEFELRHKAFKPAMLTLTYRQVGDWQPHHISELLRRIRNWLQRRGHRLRYVWVAELQQQIGRASCRERV